MKKFFHLLKAQSTLEFAMITMLVLVSIFVMGPYVVRSINAYMRSWELSVDRSRHETGEIITPEEVPWADSIPEDPCEYTDQTACKIHSSCWWVVVYDCEPCTPGWPGAQYGDGDMCEDHPWAQDYCSKKDATAFPDCDVNASECIDDTSCWCGYTCQ